MSDKIRTHKDLKIWSRSVDLVTRIYKVTEGFPKSELFGLTSQIRRAAVSVPSNIAEGSGRRTTKELIYFLHIAIGSMAELETQFIISQNLGYLKAEDFTKIDKELHELLRMTTALANNLRNEKPNSQRSV